MDEKIEEMAKIMLDYGRTKCVIKSSEEDFNYVQQYLPAVRGYAQHLIGKGYRKESDTAREICLKIIKGQPQPIKEKWVEWFKKEYGVDLWE